MVLLYHILELKHATVNDYILGACMLTVSGLLLTGALSGYSSRKLCTGSCMATKGQAKNVFGLSV